MSTFKNITLLMLMVIAVFAGIAFACAPPSVAIDVESPAKLIGNTIYARAGEQITFVGTANREGDTTMDQFDWTFDDGVTTPLTETDYNTSRSEFVYTFTAANVYTVTLSAEDNGSLPGTTVCTFQVIPIGYIYVPDPDYFITIQEAIDFADNGDTIVVSEGTYFENIDFKGKNITVKSTDLADPDTVASTIINGDGFTPVVSFDGTEEPNSVLAGFTITSALDPNLVGFWKLDETDGNTVECAVGDYDGTAYGDPNWQTSGGQLGGALQFDGENDYVKIEGYTGVTGTHSRTVSAWIKTENYNGTILYWGTAASGGVKWAFHLNTTVGWGGVTGALRLSVGGGRIVGTTDLRDNQWHHVAAVLTDDGSPDVDEIKLYVDGIEETISYDEDEPINTASDLDVLIGKDPSVPGYFDGSIDEVRIYNKDLSDVEIANLFESSGGGLAAHWKLDQSSGDAIDSFGTNDGTLNGDPTWQSSGGIIDGALDFDGAGDYVEITGYDGVTGTQSRTVTAWIQAGSNYDEILSWGSEVTGGRWLLMTGDSSIRVSVKGGYIEGSTNICDNQWHQVAAVLENDGSPDLNEIALYVDGKLENTYCTGSLAINTSSGTNVKIGLYIGNGSRYFDGMIDDVRIYSKALSSNEIRTLYANDGGGIRGNDTSATILNCVVTDNQADYGGGIYGVDGAVIGCTITNNVAFDGGGIADCNALISNSVIAGNTAESYGGGLVDCPGDIINCTVADNTAVSGGGLSYCTGTIYNNIIWGNEPNQIGDSSTPDYSCIEDGVTGGIGNISSDPNFVDPNGFDYHIESYSPCLDAGDPCQLYLSWLDIDGEARVMGGRIDIGADEVTAVVLDSDGDGLSDYLEDLLGTDKNNPDSDNDGLRDGVEYYTYGTNPLLASTDGDSLPDGWEIDNALDPLVSTGADGDSGDPDGDTLSNLFEYQNGLDPRAAAESVTVYEYDTATGDMIMQRDIEVKNNTAYMTETQTEYDMLGRRIIQRQLAAPGVGTGRGKDNTKDMITEYGYDVAGNLRKTSQIGYVGTDDPNDPNSTTEDIYDSLGRVIESIDPNGYSTTYTYEDGRLKKTTDPEGNETVNYYDNSGRLIKVVNAEGHYRTMEYDSLGRVIITVAYDSDDVALMQTRSEYDTAGHVIKQIVLDDASEPNSYTPMTTVDKITEFVYHGQTETYPGMLVETKMYYGGSPAATASTLYDYDGLGRRTLTTDPNDNTVAVTYNSLGQVERRQIVSDDPLGSNDITETTDYEYDDLGRLTKLIAKPNNPDNTTDTSWQTTEYDNALGYLIKETKPNGVINAFGYNAFGQKIVSVADFGGINQVTEWTYDQLGRQVSIAGWTDNTDDNTKQTTTYDYNRRGNVTKITYPDSETIEYAFNPGGSVKHRIDQRNFVTYYQYDGLGSLTLKTTDSTIINDPNRIYGDTPPQLTVETFSYDGAGRMLTAEKTVDGTDVSDTTFAYNDLGKLTDTWDKHFGAITAKHVGYAYDQAGLLKSTTYPDNTVVNRTNTWDGKIDSLSRSGAELVEYSYIGNRTARRAYNTTTAVNTDYSYDNLGRITDITAGTLVDFHYDYVADENNIWKKRFDHRTNTPYNQYSYDDIDRVTQIAYHDSDTEAFYMDDLGNRSGNQTLREDGTVNFTVDDNTNRYTSIAGNTITHDNAGNLTTDKDGYVHEYDCENRIISITDVNDVEIATFDYDALNRRIRKDDKIATEKTLYYYSDKWQVLSEYDDANSLQSYFVYGNYIDEPLVMNNGSDYYYLHDHLYSSVALLNGSGTVAERYEYDAYGKMTRLNPDFTAWSGTQAGNPYYFTGRRLDTLDGGSYEKMQYRYRGYKTNMGRFCQPDSLMYIDGLNLYEYVRSHVVIYTDPYGLAVIPPPGFLPPSPPTQSIISTDFSYPNTVSSTWTVASATTTTNEQLNAMTSEGNNFAAGIHAAWLAGTGIYIPTPADEIQVANDAEELLIDYVDEFMSNQVPPVNAPGNCPDSISIAFASAVFDGTYDRARWGLMDNLNMFFAFGGAGIDAWGTAALVSKKGILDCECNYDVGLTVIFKDTYTYNTGSPSIRLRNKWYNANYYLEVVAGVAKPVDVQIMIYPEFPWVAE